jgi:hypothetical protein
LLTQTIALAKITSNPTLSKRMLAKAVRKHARLNKPEKFTLSKRVI